MIICSYVSISKTGPSVKGPEEKNAPDPTASGESAAGIGGVFGRIYNPPLQVDALPFSVVGAAICTFAAAMEKGGYT